MVIIMASDQGQIIQYFISRWQTSVQNSPDQPEPWLVREFFETHITNFVDPDEIYSVTKEGNHKGFAIRAAKYCSEFLRTRPTTRRSREPKTACQEKEIRLLLETETRFEILFRRTLESSLGETWNWWHERTPINSPYPSNWKERVTLRKAWVEKILGRSDSTIKRYIKDGKLESVGKASITTESVLRFLKSPQAKNNVPSK